MLKSAEVPDKSLPLLENPRIPGPSAFFRSRKFLSTINDLGQQGPGPLISPSHLLAKRAPQPVLLPVQQCETRLERGIATIEQATRGGTNGHFT